jgi:hypothetical protein
LGAPVSVLLGSPDLADAFVFEDKYWFGGSGSWEDPNNWSPYGVPEDYTEGFFTSTCLTNAPDTSPTGYFTGADYPDNEVTLGTLEIYGSGTETKTLSISDGHLRTQGWDIVENNGIVSQAGGTVSPLMGFELLISGHLAKPQSNGP